MRLFFTERCHFAADSSLTVLVNYAYPDGQVDILRCDTVLRDDQDWNVDRMRFSVLPKYPGSVITQSLHAFYSLRSPAVLLFSCRLILSQAIRLLFLSFVLYTTCFWEPRLSSGQYS
jgi:hypothetical protein